MPSPILRFSAGTKPELSGTFRNQRGTKPALSGTIPEPKRHTSGTKPALSEDKACVNTAFQRSYSTRKRYFELTIGVGWA